MPARPSSKSRFSYFCFSFELGEVASKTGQPVTRKDSVLLAWQNHFRRILNLLNLNMFQALLPCSRSRKSTSARPMKANSNLTYAPGKWQNSDTHRYQIEMGAQLWRDCSRNRADSRSHGVSSE